MSGRGGDGGGGDGGWRWWCHGGDGGGGGKWCCTSTCHGWERERIQGIVHIDRVGQIEIVNFLIQLGTIDGSSQFCHHVRHAADIHGGWWSRGGAHAGGREGRGVHAARQVSMLSAFSLSPLSFAFSLQRVFERQGHPGVGCGLAPCLLGALKAVAIIRRRMHIQHQIAKGAGRDAFK